MASKAEIALKIVEATLSKVVPAVLDLLAKRKRLAAMVETGEEPSEAEWATADADLDAAVDALRLQLLPETEPELTESLPEGEPPSA